jgi:hypothetical protein
MRIRLGRIFLDKYRREPMKRFGLIATYLLCFSVLMLQGQWAKTYGGAGSNVGYSVQQTTDGGYIAAGYTDSFGSKTIDFWVLKLDANGGIVWQKAYGGGSSDYGYCVQQTKDGGFVVAGTTYSFGMGEYDFWVLKLNKDGGLEWQRAYGGVKSDMAQSIRQTFDGGYIVAGETYSFGTGGSDWWILKLDSKGNIEWQNTYGTVGNDFVNAVIQTTDGEFMVAGIANSADCLLMLNSIGDIQWQGHYIGTSFMSIQEIPGPCFIVAGFRFGSGARDFFVQKIGWRGDVKWQWTYGGSKDDLAYSVQPTLDGGFIVGGETQSFGGGKKDAWILKLDAGGRTKWKKTFGGNGDDDVRCVQQTTDGSYVAIGTTSSFGQNNQNFFLLKLYENGDLDSVCGFQNVSWCESTEYNSQNPDPSLRIGASAAVPKDTSASVTTTNIMAFDPCRPKCVLTIAADSGGTTDPPSGSYAYNQGSEASVRATANYSYSFSGWTGDASGTANPITIKMDGDKSIRATFSYTGGGGGGGGGGTEWGSGGGGGQSWGPHCFIATAVYGSGNHPHVSLLRNFRDRYLLTNQPGRTFVRLYYKYSPPLARFVSKHKALRIAGRMGLLPIVGLAALILRFGFILTAAAMAAAMAFIVAGTKHFRKKPQKRSARIKQC